MRRSRYVTFFRLDDIPFIQHQCPTFHMSICNSTQSSILNIELTILKSSANNKDLLYRSAIGRSFILLCTADGLLRPSFIHLFIIYTNSILYNIQCTKYTTQFSNHKFLQCKVSVRLTIRLSVESRFSIGDCLLLMATGAGDGHISSARNNILSWKFIMT